MGVWPQLFDGVARVAIYAGARAIDDGHGDISVDQANALQHRPLGPTIGNRHVFESCFTTIGDKASLMCNINHIRLIKDTVVDTNNKTTSTIQTNVSTEAK